MKEKKEKEKEKKEEREFLPAGTRTDGPIKGSTRGPRRTKKEKEGKKLETLTSTPAHIVLKTKEKQFPPQPEPGHPFFLNPTSCLPFSRWDR